MRTVLMLFVSFLLLGCGNMVKSGAIVEAQRALNKKNYNEALENTDIAETFGDPSGEINAKLHYLRAQALEGLGRLGEAVHSYRYVVEQYSSSAYAGPSQQRLNALSSSPKS